METVVQEQAKRQGNAPVGCQSGIEGGFYVLVAPEHALDGSCRTVEELEGHRKGQEVHDGFHQVGVFRIKPGNQSPAQEQDAAEKGPDQDVGQPARIRIGLGLDKIPGSHIGPHNDGQGQGKAQGHHVQHIAETHGRLVGRHGNGAEPGHQQAFHPEETGFQENGQPHGDADSQMLPDMGKGKAGNPEHVEIPEHLQPQYQQGKGKAQQPAGDGRPHPGSRSPQGRGPQFAEDEDVVHGGIHRHGQQEQPHGHLGVAQGIHKGPENTGTEQGQDTPGHKAQVPEGHRTDFRCQAHGIQDPGQQLGSGPDHRQGQGTGQGQTADHRSGDFVIFPGTPVIGHNGGQCLEDAIEPGEHRHPHIGTDGHPGQLDRTGMAAHHRIEQAHAGNAQLGNQDGDHDPQDFLQTGTESAGSRKRRFTQPISSFKTKDCCLGSSPPSLLHKLNMPFHIAVHDVIGQGIFFFRIRGLFIQGGHEIPVRGIIVGLAPEVSQGIGMRYRLEQVPSQEFLGNRLAQQGQQGGCHILLAGVHGFVQIRQRRQVFGNENHRNGRHTLFVLGIGHQGLVFPAGMGVVIRSDDEQGPVIHQALSGCLFKEVLDGLVHPVHAADGGGPVVPDILRHLRIGVAVIRIGLVHIQGLAHQEQFLVPVLRQGLQGRIVHHVVVEAPAAGPLVSHVPQVFLGQIMFHAELGGILPVFVGIVPAGSIDEIAFEAGLLEDPEQGRLPLARQVLVIDQLGPEGGIEALGGGYGRRIVMIDPGILLHQGIQVRRGIRRDVGVVMMEIIPVDTFQDQHHHPVVSRLLPGYDFLFGQDSQFFQSSLVLVRQGPFLVFPGIMDHLVGFEESFVEEVHIDGIGHHGPGGLPAFFHIHFDIQPAHTVRRMIGPFCQQHIRAVEPQGEQHHAQKGPGQVGFVAPGMDHPEQGDEQQHHGGQQPQLPVLRGAQDPFGRIDVQIVKEHAFHMHGGVPEVDPVSQDQEAGHIIGQEVQPLHHPVGPVMIAHGRQKHQDDVVEQPGQYGKDRHEPRIQLQVADHEQGIGQIQGPHHHHGEIPFHPVTDPPALGVQEQCHPGQEQIPEKIVQGMIPEFRPGKGHDFFQKIPAVTGFRQKTQEYEDSVQDFLFHSTASHEMNSRGLGSRAMERGEVTTASPSSSAANLLTLQRISTCWAG